MLTTMRKEANNNMPPRGDPGVRTTHKIKNFKGTSARLIKEFKPVAVILSFVATLLICSAILTALSPMFLQQIINGITKDALSAAASGESQSYIGTYIHIINGQVSIVWSEMFKGFGIILAFYFAGAFISWLAEFTVAKISAGYAFQFRQRIKTKLDLMPLSFYDNHTVGEILSRGTNDVDTISRSMSMIINQSINSIALFIAVVIIMFIMSWQLSLVVIATLPLCIIVTVVIAKHSQKQYVAYQNRLGAVEGHAEEQYAGFTVVKLFNKEQDSLKEFNILSDQMKKADWKSRWLSFLIFPSMRFINNVGYVAVCVIGGATMNADKIGTIAAFFIYLQLFQQPFQQLGELASTVQGVIAAAERIYELLDAPEEIKEDIDCIDTEEGIIGNISIKNVDFSYTKDKELIKDMNLEVHQGDSIAIVGPTGAGKTTIVNLLMRFYDVDSGNIILDGNDIRHYSRAALRGSIGMVLQDTWLFAGTIKENIRYGRSDATDEEVIAAAKAAHAHHFIKTLPNNYNFMLNEDGTNVSQGQRQLITIARAIVSQPKILILDEATSSVDTRTEMQIQDALDTLMVGKTSFIIAHRLSTIKNAKMIIVMNKGSIIESGNHQELLAKGGFYAELYNAQFSGTNPMAKEDKPEESAT